MRQKIIFWSIVLNVILMVIASFVLLYITLYETGCITEYVPPPPTNLYIVPEVPIKEEVIEDDYFLKVEPITLSKEEIQCLKRNVFFEAGIEPYEGKLAVAQVTINRLNTGRWGQSVCSVVYARAQFSWTLWHSKRTKVPTGPLWEDSKQVVRDFLDGVRIADINNSLHYHADYIEPPNWADADRRIAQIGQHVFYER